jgi:hypothetical protein
MSSLEFTLRRSRGLVGFTIVVGIWAGLLVASFTTDAAETALEGKWSGKIQIPGRELTLIVDLVHQTNWTGSATLTALNVKGVPLTEIKIQGEDVSFGIQAITGPSVEPPRIKAQLTDKKLIGVFLQAGNTARVVLERIGPPQVEEPPSSTPVAKEFEGEWRGEYELFGYPRKVTLKLQNHDSQPASAEFVIVGRKVNNLPVDRIVQQGSFITIDCGAFGITYEGRLQDAEIHGTVLQGPIEVALVLHRPK